MKNGEVDVLNGAGQARNHWLRLYGFGFGGGIREHFETVRSDIHCERSAELRRGINSKLEVQPDFGREAVGLTFSNIESDPVNSRSTS